MTNKIEISQEQLLAAANRLSDLGQSHLSEPLFALYLDAVGTVSQTCDRPPEGWTCSRHKGHAGPCAASPVDRQAEPTTLQWQYEAGSAWWAFDSDNVGGSIESGTKIRLTDRAGKVLFQYPADQQEPVGEVADMKYNQVRFYRATGDTSKPYLLPGTKLYTSPPTPARVVSD